jgi:hypothetical protein
MCLAKKKNYHHLILIKPIIIYHSHRVYLTGTGLSTLSFGSSGPLISPSDVPVTNRSTRVDEGAPVRLLASLPSLPLVNYCMCWLS